MDYALIGEVVGEYQNEVNLLALWGDGQLQENHFYHLSENPCATPFSSAGEETVEKCCSFLPWQEPWLTPGLKGSVCKVLYGVNGEVLGLLALMDKRPQVDLSPDQDIILRIFCSRAAAEIERIKVENELEYSAKVDYLLSQISRHLIDQEVELGIPFSLQLVGEFLAATRIYFFEYSEDQTTFELLEEWHDPQLSSMVFTEQNGAVEYLPPCLYEQIEVFSLTPATTVAPTQPHWFHQRLLNQQFVHTGFLQKMSQQAKERLGDRPFPPVLIAVPVIHREKVQGFLGADLALEQCSWQNREVPLLTRVGELVAMGRSRAKTEMALRAAKEAAETANRAKSTFLANMSHELRTPLNAILGFTQLMERDPSLHPQHRNFIDIINRSGNHLLNLINDVLEMSKIEAGKVVLIEESFNFQQLLKTLYDMLHIRAVNKGIELVFDLDPSLPIYLQTDESKLRQVLINLLGNAIKFTATGQVTLRAKVTTLPTSAIELAFAVEDTGPGIPPEEVTTLFNPFVQAQSSTQKKEGTGLGLAISRQFVQLMGGEIQVSSEWGKGSCFSFAIQAQAVNPLPPEMTPELNQTVLGILNPQQEYRILVVDDQEDNRQLLQYLLMPLGFAVRSAVEGQAAIAQWESWQPHCILMDMQMPGMDGYEATRQIRQRETGQRTVILALTASAFQEQRASILATGCDDLILKPFREEVLLDALAHYLHLEYRYAATLSPPPAVATTAQPLDLRILPDTIRQELENYALAVDGAAILSLLDTLPPEYQAIAEGIIPLVNQFEFDELLTLLEESSA